MIKFLKNQDIQITNFAVAKGKVADTLFLDLILATDDEYSFPLILPVEETSVNFNSKNITGSFSRIYDECNLTVINNDGYLAAFPSADDNNPDFQIGKKYQSDFVFYPVNSVFYSSVENPINLDGTYQGQVYNTTKNMYYNDYNNSYNQFGIDGFNNSNVKLNLQDTFVTYTLTVPQSGDRIRPFSININNQTGDIVTNIKDDGKNNLYLSGSFFINCFESFTYNTKNIINPCNSGLGKYLCTGIYDCTVLTQA